jgi:type II secretory pathway component GspD/PulD (secretin)
MSQPKHIAFTTRPTTRPRADWLLQAAAVWLLLGPALAAYGQAPLQDAVDAAEPEESEKLVTNVFYQTDLRQVLSDIATQVGVVIVPEVSVRGLVTCELNDVPLGRALDIVLAGTGFVVKKTPDYYLVCSADPKSPAFPMISETRILRLDYVQADATARMLSSSFRDYVQADKDINVLSITAPPALVERIAADVLELDRPPGHVLLEARVVVLEQMHSLNLGVQWNFPQVVAGVFSNSDLHGGGVSGPQWPWGLQIGYTPSREFTNALMLTLNMLAENDEATLIASPQVLAQDGQSAELRAATEEYFQIISTSIYTGNQLEKIETGTVLQMTPRIGSDGQITLAIKTEVSGVTARGANNLPVVTRRTAESTVRLEDGGTAVIAGLMDSRTEANSSWVPGLGRIPGLGRLFRNQGSLSSSRQVAIFITASLVPRPVEQRSEPAEPRRTLPSVEEKEFRKQMRDALAALDAGRHQ